MGQLEEILAIPGNDSVYRRAQKLFADGSAIAFIGAGVSFPLYPLWTELLTNLSNEAISKGLARDAEKNYWFRLAAGKPLQAASQIHQKLGDSVYEPFLYETFKDRTGSDGLAYTPAQAALVRCNFKPWITTNYDGGLLEARRVLRSDIRETGFTVWNQNFQIQRWSSGDLFRGGSAHRPVLFGHGHFADPPNIVLDRDSYQRAYRQTPYRRLFENLCIEQHLVFAGFSFSDATLSQIADDVLLQTARAAGTEPRHVAILGLDQDQPYTPEMRREYLDSYHSEVLFYPVSRTESGRPDHSALQVLLESLATVAEPKPIAISALKPAAAPRFVHEATDDDKFTGRTETLARLDRWAADPKVRLVAITAMGGLGKTALSGRWLRQGRHRRAAAFFWSFYRNRNTKEFLETLAQFRRETPGSTAIVLDGLEMMQEVPGSVAYGKLLDIDLSEFLHSHSRAQNGDLVILTSRFPFPNLAAYLGGALRSLSLAALEPSEGAVLLASLGVRGSVEDRERISRDLFGHPLALRIFARSMPRDLNGDPTRLWSKIFDQADLSSGDPLEAKISHLLTFYEQCLPEPHRQALSLIALFRAPVGSSTLAPLWEKLLDHPGGDRELREAVNSLHRDHLLTADPGADGEWRYACHPILRDHFRSNILRRPGFGPDAANLLAGPPDAGQATSIADVQIIATAIELLLEAGEFEAARGLYVARLNNGRVFINLPAPHLGIEVASGFFRGPRRAALVSELGVRGLGFYFNEVGLYSKFAGDRSVGCNSTPRATKSFAKTTTNLTFVSACETLARSNVLSDAWAMPSAASARPLHSPGSSAKIANFVTPWPGTPTLHRSAAMSSFPIASFQKPMPSITELSVRATTFTACRAFIGPSTCFELEIRRSRGTSLRSPERSQSSLHNRPYDPRARPYSRDRVRMLSRRTPVRFGSGVV